MDEHVHKFHLRGTRLIGASDETLDEVIYGLCKCGAELEEAEIERRLSDADSLWSGNREARAQIVHLIAWLASDLSALNRRELVEAVDRIAGDALAALPEHLK